ncbi:MAG: DNA alkylation repair protein [Gammaproteobacteria bacterium]|nr:DNA alkylation repair protein [Gammaproteobacteria bacterium]
MNARTGRSSRTAARQLDTVLAWLRRRGTRSYRDGMARYAIPSERAFGVPVGVLRAYGEKLGTDAALADALWESGWYEARMLAAFVADPARLTAAQMDRWCSEFDNWAVCDHVCFHLFDRSPLAYAKVARWAQRKGEFQRRAAFALLSSLALHDKSAPDAAFVKGLALVERAANDERNFVKKGVSWALRSIGHRNLALHQAALTLAARLSAAAPAAARWIGRDALRDLSRATVRKRVETRSARQAQRATRLRATSAGRKPRDPA